MESRLLGEAELKSWGWEDGSWTIVHHRNTGNKWNFFSQYLKNLNNLLIVCCLKMLSTVMPHTSLTRLRQSLTFACLMAQSGPKDHSYNEPLSVYGHHMMLRVTLLLFV